MDGPGTVSVTAVYGDTLTCGGGGYSRGYSMESGYPWMVWGLSE